MVTVIIPCYNGEKFVSNAIESVLKQTYDNWELILVDNNSTDGTFEVFERYRKKDPARIKLFKELIKGAPAARNRGIRESNGDWIQFLDADDELKENKLYHQIALISNQEADFVSGAAIIKGNSNKGSPKSNRKIKVIDPWIALIGSNLGITSANLFKKSLLVEVGGWNEKLTSSQEYELMFRMLKKNAKIVFDKKELTVINMVDSGISRAGNKDKRIEVLENRINLRLEIKDYLGTQLLLTPLINSIIDRYIYASLKMKNLFLPQYVHQQLKDFPLTVSLSFRLFKEIQICLLNLKRFFFESSDMPNER